MRDRRPGRVPGRTLTRRAAGRRRRRWTSRRLLVLVLAVAVLGAWALGAAARGGRAIRVPVGLAAFLWGVPGPDLDGQPDLDGHPAGEPPPQASGRRAISVMGFYTDPEPGLPGSLPAALREAGSLSYVCPFWYQVGFAGDGSIIPYGPGYDAAASREAVRQLQERGIKVLAVLHNLRLGQPQDTRAIFSKIMNAPSLRAALIRNIMQLLRDMGFDGLNLDIEFVRPSDRGLYSLFVGELAVALRDGGFIFTADLPAVIIDDPEHPWAGGFDIQAIAPHLDLAVVMAYDEHGYVTTSGPVASIGWVEEVIRYWVSVVPPEKILLGLAGHAFDWLAGSRFPKYTGYAGVMETAARTGAAVKWDAASRTPYVRYTDPATGRQREAWFENSDSFALKLDLVDRYGLGGVAVWRLGLEDPALWQLVRGRYDVVRQP